jgi:RNA polymerase sigma factor (sigma-70 family)
MSTPLHTLVRRKDPSAIKELYEQFGKKLAGFAVHKWRVSEDDAWDLVYKTLYRVLEKSGEYEFVSEQKFSGFVFTIFINYLRNHFRDRKQLPEFEDELNENTIASSAFDSVQSDNSPELSPSVHLLNQELDKLEDWERILLLMCSQDVPYSEIARLTGKSEDNLKVYYGRLKKKLEDTLSEKINALKKQRA